MTGVLYLPPEKIINEIAVGPKFNGAVLPKSLSPDDTIASAVPPIINGNKEING